MIIGELRRFPNEILNFTDFQIVAATSRTIDLPVCQNDLESVSSLTKALYMPNFDLRKAHLDNGKIGSEAFGSFFTDKNFGNRLDDPNYDEIAPVDEWNVTESESCKERVVEARLLEDGRYTLDCHIHPKDCFLGSENHLVESDFKPLAEFWFKLFKDRRLVGAKEFIEMSEIYKEIYGYKPLYYIDLSGFSSYLPTTMAPYIKLPPQFVRPEYIFCSGCEELRFYHVRFHEQMHYKVKPCTKITESMLNEGISNYPIQYGEYKKDVVYDKPYAPKYQVYHIWLNDTYKDFKTALKNESTREKSIAAPKNDSRSFFEKIFGR